ncbi:MAG: hypothetical protein A4E19_17480 [Nitrospira sp. SG-bin1]|nr:MAG: hypothetical protein A4E19_17480 [Nitrospira sp. SG-bin1]
MEQRKHVRFTVHFRSSFSSANVVSGEGTLSDLSIRGCRVFSLIEVKPGTTLQLRVHTSDRDPPIQVSQAVVRWFRSGSFGCEFVNLGQNEWARLQDVVKDLEMHPFQRERQERDEA